MELTPILTVAAKEFRDRMRNRWVLAVALVFTVFSLVIAYFGGAQQGQVGFRSIEFTIASLVSLVIYLIPLIALLLGFDAIVGERERGSLDLLLALPITRRELLLEGGIAAGVILCVYLAALAMRTFQVVKRPLQRLALLSILVILLHSLVDYPLRTMAIAMTFAFFNALFFSDAGLKPAAGRRTSNGGRNRPEILPPS